MKLFRHLQLVGVFLYPFLRKGGMLVANRIKGITVGIGGDTIGLDKALKGVNTNIRNTQSALKDVNRLLKLDPTNAELLARVYNILCKHKKSIKKEATSCIIKLPTKINKGVTSKWILTQN